MSVWNFNTVCLLVGVSFVAAQADYVPPSTAVSKVNSYRGYSELTSAASGWNGDGPLLRRLWSRGWRRCRRLPAA